MIKILLLVSVLLMSGCEVDPSANNFGFGYEYDSVTPLGIKVRNDTEDIIYDTSFDALYSMMYNCIATNGDGTSMPPYTDPLPSVLYIIQVNNIGNGQDGAHNYDSSNVYGNHVIVIESPHSLYSSTSNLTVIKHEMLHYILSTVYGDPDSSHNHTHWVFNNFGGCLPSNYGWMF